MDIRFSKNMGKHPKTFFNICLMLFGAGIIEGIKYGNEDWVYRFEIISVLLLVICAVMIWRQSRLAGLVVALLFFISGNLRIMAFMDLPSTDISNMHGQEVSLTGVLDEAPRVTEDSDGVIHLRYIVNVEGVKCRDEEKKATGKIIVYSRTADVFDKKGEKTDGYGSAGDSLKVSGKVRLLHDYQNPGRMNTVLIQKSQGINSQLIADKYSLQIKEQDGSYVQKWAQNTRDSYWEKMNSVMPKEDAAAIFAMLFGGYNGIKEELLEAFTTTGIVHILSVSGSHITLMAGTAAIIGRVLHLPQTMTVILATLTIILYGALAGAIPPVIRSALMGIITLLATVLEREKDAGHILSLVALGMLIYSPLLLYDISFQLSFGATAGLLYISPVIREWLGKIEVKSRNDDGKIWKIPYWVRGSVAVTIGAQLSVLPLIAWYFNVISISSLLANLVVVPIVEWIIVVGLLAGCVGLLIPIAGKIIFIVSSLMLGLVYEMTKAISSLPGSKMYLPTMNWAECIIYYAVLGITLLPEEERNKAYRWCYEKRKNICIVAMAAFILAGSYKLIHKEEMEVHFIDVGQGDACLVITPNGHGIMFDAGGTREGGYDVGKRVDVPYLLHYGVRELEGIFLTHAHDDHSAGVAGVVSQLPVKSVFIGHEGKDAYLKSIGTKYSEVRQELFATVKEGTRYEIDGVTIEVLYSPTAEQAISIGNATGNEFSNLFRIRYGKAAFLITGDLVKEQEKLLLDRRTDVRSTVLKVGHHGSRTSTSEDWLKSVNPKWAVISCGYENSFGHPHKEIVNRIEECSEAKILRTDEKGAIVFKTDGERMKVECYGDD